MYCLSAEAFLKNIFETCEPLSEPACPPSKSIGFAEESHYPVFPVGETR